MNIFSKPRDVEIVEDFSLDIEYALGIITLIKKNLMENGKREELSLSSRRVLIRIIDR